MLQTLFFKEPFIRNSFQEQFKKKSFIHTLKELYDFVLPWNTKEEVLKNAHVIFPYTKSKQRVFRAKKL